MLSDVRLAGSGCGCFSKDWLAWLFGRWALAMENYGGKAILLMALACKSARTRGFPFFFFLLLFLV